MTNDVSEDQVTEEQGALVVQLEGDVDLEHAPSIRKLLLDCVKRGRNLFVDLSRVDYIDSSGIASLIEALQGCTNSGKAFGLVAVSNQAMRVLELARLDKVFTIHADRESALSTGNWAGN
jgi:anti-sigma B factor antagonist